MLWLLLPAGTRVHPAKYCYGYTPGVLSSYQDQDQDQEEAAMATKTRTAAAREGNPRA